jgi:hypothetical protein
MAVRDFARRLQKQYCATRSICEEHPDSQSQYEVIPFLRITSSVNVGFPILLGELDRENDLTAMTP